jgi:hypothetical protein
VSNIPGSLAAFGSTFFEHVIAMLHPLSLTVLLEIASHPQLSRFVRVVTISGERIDGVINMSGHGDEQKHKDLQASMEHSEMAHLILTNVFRNLHRLAVVRIDNESFQVETEVIDAARCGSRYIFVEPTKYNAELAIRAKNRAFGIVFPCLRRAGIAGEVNIEMEISVGDEDSQDDNCFDPTTVFWNNNIGPNITSLELSGYVSSRRTFDLLQSAFNLSRLEFAFVEDLFHVSHPDTGLFVWPNLRHLRLIEVECHEDNFADFITAHKDTLSVLNLVAVCLITGTWQKTLQVILDMSKLEEIQLQGPYQPTPPSQAGASFDRFSSLSDWDAHEFCLSNVAEIRIALNAILFDLRTTSWKSHTSHLEVELYRVDMRLARAVFDGRAVICDGECHLVA